MAEEMMQIRVVDFMSAIKWTVTKDSLATDVYKMMKDHKIRHVPVVENEKPVGIISDRDILYYKRFEEWPTYCAKDIMTESPYTVSGETALADVVNIMAERKFNSVMVLGHRGDFIGILTSTDALKALLDLLKNNPPIIFT
jgi:acetoin utilization protein AcuB